MQITITSKVCILNIYYFEEPFIYFFNYLCRYIRNNFVYIFYSYEFGHQLVSYVFLYVKTQKYCYIFVD